MKIFNFCSNHAINFILKISIVCLGSPVIAAPSGGNTGGGGHIVETAFRLRAQDLLNQLSSNNKDLGYCSPRALKQSLENSVIRVVPTIKDPQGKCREEDSFDACSYPGEIQLLETSWRSYLTPEYDLKKVRSIDALILHEAFRTAWGCDDSNMKLTQNLLPKLNSFLFSPGIDSRFSGTDEKTEHQSPKCHIGTVFSEPANACLPEGQCPKGLVVFPPQPSMCIDPKTGMMIQPQICGVGYYLTAQGCLPQGKCPSNTAYFFGNCISVINQLRKEDFHFQNTHASALEKRNQNIPNALSCSLSFQRYSLKFKACLNVFGCQQGLAINPKQPAFCMDPETGVNASLQQCGVGYFLTEQGCKPQGNCPPGFAQDDQFCLKPLTTN